MSDFIIKDGVLKGYKGKSNRVVIPYGVTEIEKICFIYYERIKSVVIPKGVKKIGEKAFKGCKGLKSIVIPDSVTEIGESAFEFCENLRTVVLSKNMEVLSKDIFSSCKKLKRVSIPESVKEIGSTAFYSCIGLKSVRFSDKLQKIESGAFKFCSSLKSIIIPESVKEIGGVAFGYCKRLKSVRLPDGLRRISYETFRECIGLKSVTVSQNLHHIAEKAFEGCIALSEFHTSAKVFSDISVQSDSFLNCTKLTDKDGFVIINGCLCGYYGKQTDIIFPSGIQSVAHTVFEKGSAVRSAAVSGIRISLNFSEKNFHRQYQKIDFTMNLLSGNDTEFEGNEGVEYSVLLAIYRSQLPFLAIRQRNLKVKAEQYLSKHITEVIRYFTDADRLEEIKYLAEEDKFISQTNIDEMLEYAIESRKNEIFIFLTKYKNDTVGFEEVNHKFDF